MKRNEVSKSLGLSMINDSELEVMVSKGSFESFDQIQKVDDLLSLQRSIKFMSKGRRGRPINLLVEKRKAFERVLFEGVESIKEDYPKGSYTINGLLATEEEVVSYAKHYGFDKKSINKILSKSTYWSMNRGDNNITKW